MLAKMLSATLEPTPTPDLAELAAELDTEGQGRKLNVDTVERVLQAKLSKRPLLVDRLTYLKDCSRAGDEVRRDGKFQANVMELLPKVQLMLGNYAALSMTCAELFGFEGVPRDQAAGTLAGMREKNELPTPFLMRIVENVEADEMAGLFSQLLTAASERLRGRDLQDQKLEDLTFITAVCASKGPLPKLLLQLPVFKPAPGLGAGSAMPPMMMPGQRNPAEPPGEGFRLQTESLLGWVIAPTCIDTALYKEKSARQVHFQNLARKTRPAVTQAQSLLRSSLGDIQTQIGNIVNPLLRTGDEARLAVAQWYGELITGTESRTKSGNLLDQGGGPNHFLDSMENSPMPMHQNLDMRLGMQIMQARMQGFATPGMAINAFWSLLNLVKPIKLAQVGNLDPYYILNEQESHKSVLGGVVKESRFGDSDEVEAAKELAKASGALNAAVKFPTQVFWLGVRAMHVLLVPVLKEELCFAYAAGYFQSRDMAKMEQALGEHLVHETILDSGQYLSDLAALLNLEMAFCLSAALPDRMADIVAGKVTGSILPTEVSPQWSVLPSCILEDLIEVLEYYTSIRPPGQPPSELFYHLNSELLMLLLTFMLGSSEHMKNPSLRGKATTILMNLSKQADYAQILQTSPCLAKDIVPGCVRVFTAVEKTKQSYYDIRMQLKYQLRIPIMELLEKVLPLDTHRKALKSFASEHSEEFYKFLNMMMNDATMQLEEGMDSLLELRKLVREGGEAALQRPAAGELNQDEQNASGEDVYRRSRADPKEHCKTYMNMGNRTIRTLWSVSREAPMVIVGKLNVLQQMLHNMLNPCLDRLVGPRCLELKMAKGAQNDFDEFNFKPKELLQMVCEMYVFLARAERDKVKKMVIEDGRSYKAKTFQKAATILGREQLIDQGILKDFEKFVKELNELAASQEAALASVDIPDNYLDPIMSEIMEDPVLLPTSKTIMDRKVIERHIMSNDDDPFNRMPLAVKDLVPEEALRTEIQAFCLKHGIAIGGDA